MLIRWGLKQSFRTPRRLAAYFLVTAVVCAFLCIGLNMKKTADDNLQNVLDNFNVAAYPDFKAYITENGQLAASPYERFGYLPCKAENFDLEQLLELPGVTGIDVRNQFGACINNHEGILYEDRMRRQSSLRYDGSDVVIFQLEESEPVIVPGAEWQKTVGGKILQHGRTQVGIELLWSASGRKTDVSNITMVNPFEMTYELEPGKTYIANLGSGGYLNGDIYHNPDRIYVRKNGAYYMQDIGQFRSRYTPITEYYEGFWDTDIGKYYRQSAEACYLNGNSMTAITTGDLSAIPSWASGDIFLNRGALFSEEDYANGNRVCIISEQLLERMGWQLGDTIDFSFYETSYPLGQYIRNQYSTFDPFLFDSAAAVAQGETDSFPLDHVFDENTYTIIGTYSGKVCRRDDHESYLFNESMHWTMVLFPESSIQNQPAPKLSPYHTTIQLEPLMIRKFLAAAQSSGMMEERSYGYQLGLTIDDQGLSNMVAGLESLQQVSRLILTLSAITAVLAVVVLVILHLLQSRKQIAVLRSMGVKKAQAAVCVLSGILVVCLLGAALGAFAGQQLAVRATEAVFATAMEDTMDSSFSAMLVTDTDESDDFQLAAAAAPALTWRAAGVVAGAIVLLSLSLTLWETKKPPLLVLGVKE